MKPTNEDLVLYADNALSSKRKQQLRDSAEKDPVISKQLQALDKSRLPFKAAFERQQLPPLPDDLRQKVTSLSRSQMPKPSDYPKTY